MDNPRDLPLNRATGNFVDGVAAAYVQYQRLGGDMVFKQWHDAHAPQHSVCTSCYNTVASR